MNPFKSKSVRAATAISLIFAVAACGGQSESEEKATESANSSQETSAAEAASDAVETAEEALSAAEEEAADAIENAEPDPDDMMKAASETAEAASAKLANVTSDVVAAGDSMVQSAVMETTEKVELIQAAVTDEASAVVSGDAVAGKRAFVKCMACHTVNEGQHRVGPSLYGIIGKTAGTVEGFRTYSPANKNSGVTWTPEVLFEYLENPQQFMPGTRMVFPGIPGEKERNDLIAYLQSASE